MDTRRLRALFRGRGGGGRGSEDAAPAPAALIREFWERSPILAWVKSGDLRYVYFSNAFRERFGPETAKWLGRTDADIHPPEIAEPTRRNDLAVLVSGQPAESVESVPGKDGDLHHFLVIRFPFDAGEGARHLAGISVRIGRQKMREYELARRAVVDELTGLYNRYGFLLFSEHELKAARRRRVRCAVVYVDIDGLQQVNERHGRHEGDVLLIGTAILLRDEFREGGIVCRSGGGQFAVFLPEVAGDPEDLKRRVLAQKASFPFSEAQKSALQLSIGVASAGPDDDAELAALMAAAELALYNDRKARRQSPGAGPSPA